MTDGQLICLAQSRDSKAWQTIARRYLPLVWRYAYALLEDAHAAEDVVSETMMALVKSIDQLNSESPQISAWLRSVVRHKVADHHRSNYRLRDRLAEKHRRYRTDSPELTPAEVFDVAEVRVQVLEVLESMSERQRVTLEWKYLEGMKVRQIAERLGETEKAVEATLYRARREFRRRFDALGHSVELAPEKAFAPSDVPTQ